MKHLFIFAHPDDETVATGGTIRQLVDRGDEVRIVLATAGAAGEVDKRASKDLQKAGSLAKLRRLEFAKACASLGVVDHKIMGFVDGKITNSDTWGRLYSEIVQEIEGFKPDFVYTFDHSGWYFHLDHVGVSIATTRAVYAAKHKVDGLFLVLFRPKGITKKWNYAYSKILPTTHTVAIRKVLAQKVEALKAHKSQAIGFLPLLAAGLMNTEYFQLVFATVRGKGWLANSIFKVDKK